MSEQIASSYPHLFTNDGCDPCAKKVESCDPCDPCAVSSGHGTNKFAYFILWWLILVVIIWFIIYSLQPSWVMKSDDCHDDHAAQNKGKHQNKCQIDQGKAILVSVIIAFILIIIFYFVSRSYWK